MHKRLSKPMANLMVPSRPAVRLFFAAFLMLFLELVLIRYLAGNVWNMGYFPNLVLMGVFIGMGLGFVCHQSVAEGLSPVLVQAAAFLLALLVIFLYFKHPTVPGFSQWLGSIGGEVYFTASPAESSAWDAWVFIGLFLSVVLTFSLLAQRTAKFFRLFPPLRAYTLDVSGSCAGILAFMLCSWLQLPAWSWFVGLIPLFLVVLHGSVLYRHLPVVAVLSIAAVVVWKQDTTLLSQPEYSSPIEVRWSPYQKVEYVTQPTQHIFVNGIGHQGMVPVSSLKDSFYLIPYQYRAYRKLPPAKDVLVIGAGSGNDVAAALLSGAARVDAVEIDPVIADLGKHYHPARPYQDARVHLVVDDARAFMSATTRKYDLIIFALTDSLVKVSPIAQLRLENYIFTVESIRTAWHLLQEDGNLIFYNSYRLPWIARKLELMTHSVTGVYPLTLSRRNSDFAVIIADPRNAGQEAPVVDTDVSMPTDDWPFLYLRTRGIPAMYLAVMIALGVLFVLFALYLQFSGRKENTGGQSDALVKGAFFCMGLAFLLLETKSVVQFSLLFGTTWLNNSLVFLAVLVFVLLANHLANWFPRPWMLYAAGVLLSGLCVLQLVYPLGNLLAIQQVSLRFAVAALMTFSPIFFANLIFSMTLRDRPFAEHLFGWNLLGAFCGGLLEYTSMAIGYNWLSCIVLISYSFVFVLMVIERKQQQRPSALPVASSSKTMKSSALAKRTSTPSR
jgi:SAM-dependent methyltransferase